MANIYLTAPQAARQLGLAPFSLQRMARRGEVRFQRLGRMWLFERREITRLKRTRAASGRLRHVRAAGEPAIPTAEVSRVPRERTQ